MRCSIATAHNTPLAFRSVAVWRTAGRTATSFQSFNPQSVAPFIHLPLTASLKRLYAAIPQRQKAERKRETRQPLFVDEEEGEEAKAPLTVIVDEDKELRIVTPKKKKKALTTAQRAKQLAQHTKVEIDPETGDPILKERIAKRLARSGICSRRDAEELIRQVCILLMK